MIDKELADRVVALGVGYQGKYPLSKDGVGFYHEPDEGDGMCAELFVRDWRVAGALIKEKLWGCNIVRKGNDWDAHVVPIGQIREYIARNENAERAIIEACVEALDGPR